MGSGNSNPINVVGDTVTRLGEKIYNSPQNLGEKSTQWIDSFGNYIKKGWQDINEDISNPVLNFVRPLTELGGKIFDLKNEFINQIPFAGVLLNAIEDSKYGDKLKLLNETENFLRLINSGKYKQAQEYMIKKQLNKYVMNDLPSDVRTEIYKKIGLDTV